MCLPILIAFFTTAPGRKYYHDSHFLEEETEAQSAWITCSLSHGARKQERKLKLETSFLVLFPLALGSPLSAELGCEGRHPVTPPSRCCGACVTLSSRVRVEDG